MLKQRMWLAVALVVTGIGAQATTPDTQITAAQTHTKAAQLASQRVLPKWSQKGAIAPATTIDGTPPTLTQFRAGKQLTVGNGLNQLLIQVSATDDLVGLNSVQARLVGPSGETTYLWNSSTLPAPTQWSGALVWQPDVGVESGVWRVDWLLVVDYNGNMTTYDETQLAKLGNTRITVTGPDGDRQGPQLLAGRIMSPSLSLTRTVPGSDGDAQFVRVDLDAQDLGVAGLREASVQLCIVGDRDCYYNMYLRGEASGERGSGAATLVIANQLPWRQLAGTYEIREVSLLDQAGNQTFLTSRAYGGNTDFTTLFPTTTLKVKP